MTILSENSRMTYTGNGATATYSFTFKVFNQSDLLVTVKDTDGVESTLTLTTDYTVTINANGTGSITLVNASQGWLTGGFLTTDYILVIRRNVDLTQETDIRNQGAFYPEAHEDAFDYLTMIDQQQQDALDRSIKLPESETGTMTIPTVEVRAGNLLGFNSGGAPIATTEASGLAVIDGGGRVVVQEDILSINDLVYFIAGTTDPTSVAVSAPKGSLYLNTSNGFTYRKDDAGSSTNWKRFGTLTGSETLTNKTLTDPVVNVMVFDDQGSTPNNPSAGFYKFYVKSDGKFYRLDSTGLEQTASGGPSLGTNSVIRTNAQTISENITFAGTENGSTVGPVTIANTYTVTVTSGSNWVII
jgi:hypothetical protein